MVNVTHPIQVRILPNRIQVRNIRDQFRKRFGGPSSPQRGQRWRWRRGRRERKEPVGQQDKVKLDHCTLWGNMK